MITNGKANKIGVIDAILSTENKSPLMIVINFPELVSAIDLTESRETF